VATTAELDDAALVAAEAAVEELAADELAGADETADELAIEDGVALDALVLGATDAAALVLVALVVAEPLAPQAARSGAATMVTHARFRASRRDRANMG